MKNNSSFLLKAIMVGCIGLPTLVGAMNEGFRKTFIQELEQYRLEILSQFFKMAYIAERTFFDWSELKDEKWDEFTLEIANVQYNLREWKTVLREEDDESEKKKIQKKVLTLQKIARILEDVEYTGEYQGQIALLFKIYKEANNYWESILAAAKDATLEDLYDLLRSFYKDAYFITKFVEDLGQIPSSEIQALSEKLPEEYDSAKIQGYIKALDKLINFNATALYELKQLVKAKKPSKMVIERRNKLIDLMVEMERYGLNKSLADKFKNLQ